MKKIKLIKQASYQRGFTLIEIMVVVIIIGVLAGLVAPQFFKSAETARKIAAESDIKRISSQMSLYRLDNFSYPTTAEGINALVSDPGKRNWNGPYLKDLPLDPWDNEYQYQFPGSRNTTGFDLWSLGADNQPGGEGPNADIGNWGEEG